MSRRARVWAWVAVAASAAVMVGLIVYYVDIGMDKASAISGVIISILAVPTLLVGLIALFKDGGSESKSSGERVRQSIRSGKGSVNIQAGNSVKIDRANEGSERQ